jgi:uncharacterized phage protein (TIGR01671 family)
MRPIKFRAWHKKANTMIAWEWLWSVLTGNKIAVYEAARVKDWNNNADDTAKIFEIMPYANIFGLDELVLMQFTGLLDKNGKEIYEGDVVKDMGEYWQERVREIVWSEGHFVPLVRAEYGHNCLDGYDSSEWEIVGNIYENSELLKEGKE